MKASTWTVPIIFAILIFLFVWAMGMLTIKSGMITTRGSMDLLRLHAKVAKVHDELTVHSRQHLKEHLDELSEFAADAHPEPTPHTEAQSLAPANELNAPILSARERELRPWPGR